jgi:opacity protein-like surface antigen
MRSRILFCLALAAILLPAAHAADVTGKWKAEFTTPDGTQRTNTFTLKANGSALTGTVAGTQDETPIQNGKVDGDAISFSAERPFGKFTYQGKITGDEIKFKVEFNDQSFEITAKRVKN